MLKEWVIIFYNVTCLASNYGHIYNSQSIHVLKLYIFLLLNKVCAG